MSVALLAAGALLLATSPGHGGHTPTPATPGTPTANAPAVTMTGQAFLPRDVVALVGEDVTWSNTDERNHTVTDSQDGDAETFDSGTLLPGATYVHAFAAQGSYSYRCTIHRFMTGTVRVFGLALDAPAVVLPGKHGAPHAGARRRGRWRRCSSMRTRACSRPWRTVLPAADGTLRVDVEVHEPGTYRVRAGELTSPAVQVRLTSAVTAAAPDGRARRCTSTRA